MAGSSDLPKPWNYKEKWLVWPKTVLNFIEVAGCNDTIDGMCLKNQTVEQCIDQCVRGCGAGYHIQFDNGDSICVPLYTDLHPHLNPAYRLRKQDLYPNLDHVKISTFIDTTKFPFPPNYGNAVFFRDILSIYLAHSEQNMEISSENPDGTTSNIYMGTSQGNNLQLVLSEKTVEKFSYYMPVQYGSKLVIVIPGTTLAATVDPDSQALQWKPSHAMADIPSATFTVLPVDDNSHKIGDVLAYGDKFILQFQESSMFVVKDRSYGFLKIVYQDKNETVSDPNSVFKCESKMIGSYCEDGQCKPVPIRNIDRIGTAGRYKNTDVYRNGECWGICKYKTGSRMQVLRVSFTGSLLTAFGITLCVISSIIVGLVVFRKLTRKK